MKRHTKRVKPSNPSKRVAHGFENQADRDSKTGSNEIPKLSPTKLQNRVPQDSKTSSTGVLKLPEHDSGISETKTVSTIQIQHTESFRCVLRAIGIENLASQPQIVSKTIAANRVESYRFASVSVGGSQLLRIAAAWHGEEHGLRLLQADSTLNIYGCDHPRPGINLTRRVRSFLRVQSSSATAATNRDQEFTKLPRG